LSADLGGGKTTLTKGIAKGLAISQTVTSPSFTISRVYDGRDQLTLHHFDFYRLQDPGILAHEISEVVKNNKAVAVIEWGESVKKILPKATTRITIERTDTGEDSRLITVTLPATHRYLLEGQV
jgi:tRNA threonylcarbamoyladenosine biosynthesis protein TsaE